MASHSDQDLGALTLESCRTRIGTTFTRPNPEGPDVVVELLSADRMKRDPRAPGPEDRPFCLVFRGPVDPRLTQGMHHLEHPDFTLRGLFLVPVGQDEEGVLYEAVLS